MAEQVFYVDPKGSNANDGLTDLTPLKTLSNVVAKAGIAKKTVIRAAAGEYAEEAVFDGQHWNRVSLYNSFIRLKGAGADKSTIRGLADVTIGDDRHGCGTNAMRCVMMGGTYINNAKRSTGRQAVQGFTLADGAAGYEGDGTASTVSQQGGGDFGGVSRRLVRTNRLTDGREQ